MRTESETDSCHRLRATTTTTRIYYTLIDVTVAAFAFCPCVCVRVFFYFNIFSVYTHRAGFPSSRVNIFSMLHSLQDLLFSFYFIQLHITMKKKYLERERDWQTMKESTTDPPLIFLNLFDLLYQILSFGPLHDYGKNNVSLHTLSDARTDLLMRLLDRC